MLPGGEDIFFKAADPISHRPTVVAIIRGLWGEAAIIEDADGGPLWEGTKEILAYRNAKAFLSWQSDGANGDNGDDMLHVLLGQDTITCVVDGPDTTRMANLIRARTTKRKP